jgi:hypothetical protein
MSIVVSTVTGQFCAFLVAGLWRLKVNTIYQSPMEDNLSDLSKDVHLVAIERTGIPVPPRFFSTINQVLTKIQIFWSLTPPHITPVSPIDLKIRMRR